MWIPFVLVCLLVGPGAPSQASSNFHQIWKGIHEDIKANPVLQHALLERLQLVTSADSDFNPQFNCEIITSDTPPTTVDDLMPGDINMIAAMGDSVTAGHGITFDVATPTPSRSWSIGGKGSLDTGFISLPNILRKYNPDLVGYSSGSILPSNWGFNVANAGDIARDIPGQAEKLVDKMMNGGEGDFNNDWKLITLLIGGNDLCHYCEDEVLHSPAQYTAYIAEALDVLYQKVPRTVVNMVAMSDITPLTDYSTNWFCSFVQKQICPCATNAASKQQLRQIQLAYYEHLVELMESGRYDDKDDFRVILQPTMVDLVPPTDPETGEPDASWLSTDCFHPNEKAHHFLAVNLWNSMLIPVGEKPRRAVVDLSDPQYLCPTKQQPYFYTPLNINIRNENSTADPAVDTTESMADTTEADTIEQSTEDTVTTEDPSVTEDPSATEDTQTIQQSTEDPNATDATEDPGATDDPGTTEDPVPTGGQGGGDPGLTSTELAAYIVIGVATGLLVVCCILATIVLINQRGKEVGHVA